MWTIQYKGFYIHGYCDINSVKVLGIVSILRFKSLHAAKLGITKLLKGVC